MFIGWISQMVALLNKDEGPAVHDILISIATNYPQALCYPFKITSCAFETNPPGEANEETVEKLASLSSVVLNRFEATTYILACKGVYM